MCYKSLPIAIVLIVWGTGLHAMDVQKPFIRAQWIQELSETQPNLTTIRSLAEQGADVNVPGIVTTTVYDELLLTFTPYRFSTHAIIVAAKQNDWDLLTLLLHKGANPNVSSEFLEDKYYTPLHFAVDKRVISAIEALIAAKANIDAVVGWYSWTPLRIVMQHRYDENRYYVGLQEEDKKIITLLLRAGAQTYIADSSGITDASYAQEHEIDLSALR